MCFFRTSMAQKYFFTAVLGVFMCYPNTITAQLRTSLTCENYYCGNGEECFMKEALCSNTPCPLYPSCRRTCDETSCQNGAYCLNGNCVTSCVGVDCDFGQQCVLQNDACVIAPCPPPIPTCQPLDPCASVVPCRRGYRCVNGICIPTCDDRSCGPQQECYLQNATCIQAPCYPFPACRPIQICTTSSSCRAGYNCVNNICVRRPSCDNFPCGPGQECHLEIQECITVPCPLPEPVCRPSCNVLRCPSQTICINGRCVSASSCNGVVCGPGQQCVLQNIPCFSAPCPPPIPTCQPIVDPCAFLNCGVGFECVNGNTCIPVCEGRTCAQGQECYLQNVTCIQQPCYPIPACRPILTCATINCIAGFSCVNNQCVRDPTCDGFLCGPGEACRLERRACITAPCPPPEPVCRPSCLNTVCPGQTTCVNGQCVPAY